MGGQYKSLSIAQVLIFFLQKSGGGIMIVSPAPPAPTALVQNNFDIEKVFVRKPIFKRQNKPAPQHCTVFCQNLQCCLVHVLTLFSIGATHWQDISYFDELTKNITYLLENIYSYLDQS